MESLNIQQFQLKNDKNKQKTKRKRERKVKVWIESMIDNFDTTHKLDSKLQDLSLI